MATISQDFKVMPLGEAIALLRENRLPPKAVAITFDDGYFDNHAVALPILQRHGLTATFFICSGYLDDGLMFNDLITEAVRQTALGQIDLGLLKLGQRTLTPATDVNWPMT